MTTPITEGRTIHRARLYDLGTELLGAPIRGLHRSVLDVAAVLPGERILDVGCGPGRLTLAAARAAGLSGDTQGIDASPEMIEVATRKARRAHVPATFRVAPIEAIPSASDHFDVVLANLMIHHLPEDLQRRAFAEVFRVLKPNGRFIVGDFRAMQGHGVGHVLSLLGLRGGTEHADHLQALATSAGFEATRIHPAAWRAFCVMSARKPQSAA